NLDSLRLSKDKVLVTDMEFGDIKTSGGIILSDDDGKSHGIRPRWARVVKIGTQVTDLNVNDYVLLKHGRWTRAMEMDHAGKKVKVFMIDYPDAVLVVSSNKPAVLDNIIS